MSSVTMVEKYPQNKRSTIAIRPYFDSNVDNMGLQKYGLSLFDGAFHEEQVACLEINGIKRYLTGLNEYAPEIKDLPMEERTVDVFRYKSIKNNGESTVDEKIEDLARRKQILIDSFLMTVKEAAIDCKLFENHNMMSSKYQCFQFNESSLFDQQIGPAYNEDMYYDSKLNNGLNAQNSEIKKVKVLKIKGIKMKDGIKQKSETYWYNPDTGVVYDFDLDYQIGRIKEDQRASAIVDLWNSRQRIGYSYTYYSYFGITECVSSSSDG